VEQAKKGVALFLATAMTPKTSANSTNNSSNDTTATAAADLFVSRTNAKVVIKAVPHPVTPSEGSTTTATTCVDDPYTEVASLQLLESSSPSHSPYHHPHVINLLDVMQVSHNKNQQHFQIDS